jgi:hypothetical protein
MIEIEMKKTGNVGQKGLKKPSARFRAKKNAEASRLRSHTLDLKRIRAYAEVGCTLEEIAGLLGVAGSWLHSQVDKDFALEEAILTGCSNLRQSLRSAQVRLALSGNPQMLIWLGKQFLGQSEKSEIKREGTVNVVLQDAVKELRNLGRDEVMAIKSIIDASATDAVED